MLSKCVLADSTFCQVEMETESFFFLVESQMVLESTKNKLTQRKEKKKKE